MKRRIEDRLEELSRKFGYAQIKFLKKLKNNLKFYQLQKLHDKVPTKTV